MKIISAILSIFLIVPLLSGAAVGPKLEIKVKTPSYKPAFPKERIPRNLKFGDYKVTPEVAQMFPRDVLRAFGNVTLSGKDAYTAAQYFESMSAASARLQNRGVSPEKLAKMKKAFAAAAIQSVEWNSEAKDKVVDIMDRLAVPGGYKQHEKQVDTIEENCGGLI